LSALKLSDGLKLGYIVSRTPGETEREYYHSAFSLQLLFKKIFAMARCFPFVRSFIRHQILIP
jgi:hypothetical protein